MKNRLLYGKSALLLSAATLAGCGLMPAQQQRGLYAGESNEMWATPPEFSAVGERWQARLNEGKALLIFAVPKTKFGDEIDIRRGTSTYSSGTLWFHSKTKNVKGLSVTLGSDSAIAYRVMFYEPGTYNMEHFFGLMHGSQFNEKMADRQPKPLSVGVVDFSGTYTYEWGSKTVWREPKYERRRSEQFVCSYVIAGTDQCISGNYVQGTQTVMTDAGGRDSIPVSEKRSAVHSHVMLKQPFASITVNAGEVIITDGIVGKLPNVDYADDACMPTADKKARCELRAFVAETVPVNLERFNAEQLRLSEIETGIVIKAQGIEFDRSKRNKSGNGIYDTNVKISDSMRAVLSRAQYRPLKIHGTPLNEKYTPIYGGKAYGLFAK